MSDPQLGLFDALLEPLAPAFDTEFLGLGRTLLSDDAWFDYAHGWLSGQRPRRSPL